MCMTLNGEFDKNSTNQQHEGYGESVVTPHIRGVGAYPHQEKY